MKSRRIEFSIGEPIAEGGSKKENKNVQDQINGTRCLRLRSIDGVRHAAVPFHKDLWDESRSYRAIVVRQARQQLR